MYWIPHAVLSQGGSQFRHWIALCSSLDAIHLCEAGFSAASVIKMQGLQENQWEQEERGAMFNLIPRLEKLAVSSGHIDKP